MAENPAARSLVRRLVFSALLAGAVPLMAAPQVDAGLDTTSILIGEPLWLTLTVSAGPGETVRFPDVAASLDTFELLSSTAVERLESGDGSTVQRRRFKLTTFETGLQTIPRLQFVAMGSDGSVDTLYTGEIKVQVVSLLADSSQTEVRPLKALVPAARLWHRLALWAAAVLLRVVLPLVIAWRRYLARRAARLLEAVRPAVPSRPAHLVALEELDRIKSLGLIEKGEIKLFHELVSAAVRTYLEGRFGVDALEMTTWEVLAALEDKLPAEGRVFGRFRDFLEACDLVKFAKYKPPLVEINSVFNLAYDLVESTRRAEAVPPGPPEEVLAAAAAEGSGGTTK
ncbi:MAG: hypothetical protein JXQ83_13955 [Candidatus Glassbacteria bacterium]|nr:hypothetical protein [Candidatus Glassbacteria bacterium]